MPNDIRGEVCATSTQGDLDRHAARPGRRHHIILTSDRRESPATRPARRRAFRSELRCSSWPPSSGGQRGEINRTSPHHTRHGGLVLCGRRGRFLARLGGRRRRFPEDAWSYAAPAIQPGLGNRLGTRQQRHLPPCTVRRLLRLGHDPGRKNLAADDPGRGCERVGNRAGKPPPGASCSQSPPVAAPGGCA
jgi:hypothetical protein